MKKDKRKLFTPSTLFLFVLFIIILYSSLFLLVYFGNPQWHKSIYLIQKSGIFGLFPDRRVAKRPGCSSNNNSQYTGLWRDWSADGTKTYEGHFKNGKEEGKHTEWYPQKWTDKLTIRSKTEYVNGIRHGTEQSYYRNGQLWISENYKHGINHGKYLNFFDNGQIRYDYSWKDGKRDGSWKKWNINGKLISDKQYKAGKEILNPDNITVNKAAVLKLALNDKLAKKIKKSLNTKSLVEKTLGPPPWQYHENCGSYRYKYSETTGDIEKELLLYFDSEDNLFYYSYDEKNLTTGSSSHTSGSLKCVYTPQQKNNE